MKKKKQFIVFGLGRFGKSVALTLEQNGINVCAVDNSEDNLDDVADSITDAVKADLSDPDSYEVLGDTEYDGAIIAIGENLEAATHAVMWAEDHGIPLIIAKAANDVYGRILKKLGADRIIFPERETGMHIALSVVNSDALGSVELAEGYTISGIETPGKWVGKSLRQLNLRESYGINIIGKKNMSRFEMNLSADEPLSSKDTLIILGRDTDIEKIKKL